MVSYRPDLPRRDHRSRKRPATKSKLAVIDHHPYALRIWLSEKPVRRSPGRAAESAWVCPTTAPHRAGRRRPRTVSRSRASRRRSRAEPTCPDTGNDLDCRADRPGLPISNGAFGQVCLTKLLTEHQRLRFARRAAMTAGEACDRSPTHRRASPDVQPGRTRRATRGARRCRRSRASPSRRRRASRCGTGAANHLRAIRGQLTDRRWPGARRATARHRGQLTGRRWAAGRGSRPRCSRRGRGRCRGRAAAPS